MAEDLLQPKKKKMVEEVGEDYLNELISRSFFQSSKDSFGKPCFTMHDLINDLAKFVSGYFCVRLEDNDSFNITSKTRHLSYMNDDNLPVARSLLALTNNYSRLQRARFDLGLRRRAKKDDNLDLEKFEALYEAKCLRTFLPLFEWRRRGQPKVFEKVLPDLLLKLQCLRVLSLSRYAINELPDSVSKLIHLRYLDLSYTLIEKLPDAVCGLYNLQTLLLTNCAGLAQLPTSLGRLIHLRHVDFRHTKLSKMPSEMCKLKELQTLPLDKFVLDNEIGNNIVDLKELQELQGTLHISGLDNIVDTRDALGANMREKKYLTTLALQWGGDIDDSRKDQEVLGNLQPHTNIREVTINSYRGTNFPAWLGDYCFSNLVSVVLEYCANCFSLPALEQLPALKTLKLLEVNIETFRGTAKCPRFPSLVDLDILDCPNLVCFPDGGLHAPNLVKINIYYCENLRSLPEEMRTLLPSLRDITIKYCPELGSFPEGGLPCKLELMNISGCEKLVENRMQWGLLQLTSLRQLEIEFQKCEEEIHSFPEDGLLPTTLTHLAFGSLSNLKTINSKELKRLISLGFLTIFDCPELLCLPDDGFPISLSELRIIRCPLVTQRCKKDKGEDWPKIARIPFKDIYE